MVTTVEAAGSVTIIINDEAGSLLDNDGDPDDDDLIAGDTVTIISDSTGSIGEDLNPLEIAAAKVVLKNLDR